jgi:hypothetical protein
MTEGVANVPGAQGWCLRNIARIADGLSPDRRLRLARATGCYLRDGATTAWRRKRAWDRPAPA